MNSKYPFIQFHVRSHRASSNVSNYSISLPVPQGLTIADGATFANLDLGMIRSQAVDTTGDGQNSADRGAATLNDIANAGRSGANDANFLALSLAGSISSSADQVASLYGINNNIAVNPNTVLQFQGPEMRTFAFQFRLIASSESESRTIKNMVTSIRESIYPEIADGNKLILEYPDVWSFSFGGGAQSYIPRSHNKCYCTNFTATYNSNTNAFHESGAPFDVTLNISLREAKSLTRQEIRTTHREVN